MNDIAAAYRHAAYFAPAPDSAAWLLGAQWLGRCPRSGKNLAQPVPDYWKPSFFAQITREPRRYGWHATLKAPFVLESGYAQADLQARFVALATSFNQAFTLQMEVAQVGNFLALVLRQPCQPLQDVARACEQLHACAAALLPSEVARRSRGGLSPRQQAMLAQWGYPYVLEDFVFHMTLTGPLDSLSAVQTEQLAGHARNWFAPLLAQGLCVDAVSWFCEAHAGGDFHFVERFGFAS